MGVIQSARNLYIDANSRYKFNGLPLSNARITGLVTLANAILADYGNPTTKLGKAAAIMDWVARTIIHPSLSIHPNGSTANTLVLPVGETWTTYNTAITASSNAKITADDAYWAALSYEDGVIVLEKLFGTLNTGTGAFVPDGGNPGLMTKVTAGGFSALYRMNSIAAYKGAQCTIQDAPVQALCAALGIQTARGGLPNHDPVFVYIPESGGWLFGPDPCFSEYFTDTATGKALTVLDILGRRRAGVTTGWTRQQVKPVWDTLFYNPLSYLAAGGLATAFKFAVMALNNNVIGTGTVSRNFVTMESAEADAYSAAPFIQDKFKTPRVTSNLAFQDLGVCVALDKQNQLNINLSSTWAGHTTFQRSINGGAFATCTANDTLYAGIGTVTYRSIDALGFYGLDAIVTA